MADDGYPWTRQENEGALPYSYFQAYLRLGPGRSLHKTAAEVGKSHPYMEECSGKFNWHTRARCYDSYLAEAAVDGAVEWITNARTETQALADKLRGLLSTRLDDCIRTKQDPTVRWSQAASVLLKMQEHGIPPVDDTKMAAELDRVAKLLEKVTGDREKV